MKKLNILSMLDLSGYMPDDHLLYEELKLRKINFEVRPWENYQHRAGDIALIRTTWNYTEHYQKFCVLCETIKDELYNPLEIIKWNSNKKYLIDLEKSGSKIIPIKIIQNNEDLKEGMKDLPGDEFIVKPTIGAGASGLEKFHRKDQDKIVINEEMILQSFIPEIKNGEISLMFFNRKYSYAIKKTPKSGEIRCQEEFGGTITSYNPRDEEIEIASKALEIVPNNPLYARVDIIPDFGIIELECIEPALYFSADSNNAKLFCDELEKIL